MDQLNKLGIVSGYFNPLHFGHIEYINAAKNECDKLIVIINNDAQRALKGSKQFMDETHRMNIIKNLKSVDDVFLSVDTDKSVSQSIRAIFSLEKDNFDIVMFFNSGDRNPNNNNTKESIVCQELKILEVFIDLAKIYSSSKLI